ncbi:hypothetical protein [Flectobacillus sp. BAB-3569]|uniref:hypothetical protein n=1 Tax=Flectobacillus sp. BAB-3569 TaxID=1509483 RepID=UPI000BA2F696|nr:hypothetical protein [Flectobacillus sp. BAB-3569]PAC29201.1 hypothetical protein BWI92_16350 [Flectobacillus sp. BAB-3569]
MTYKTFLSRFVLLVSVSTTLFAGLNYYIDIFGLFRGTLNRKVYINERTSKFLFSYRYIPDNFNAVLIGPSLSANINPQHFEGLNVYNASIMSANISELNLLMENILSRGKMKTVLICLDPYLTKDHGRKTSTMIPQEYWGALGSTNLLRTYLFYFIRNYNLIPSRYAPNLHNEVGWDNFGLETPNANARKAITDKVNLRSFENTSIDSVAYHELDHLLKQIRAKNIKIIAYFTPVPYQLYSLGRNEYSIYQRAIGKLFKSSDVLINLNDEKYKTINSDYKTFLDHGHLNPQGQAFVINQLNNEIKQLYNQK